MFLETKPHKFFLNLLVLKCLLRNLYLMQSTVPQVVLNFWIPGLLMLALSTPRLYFSPSVFLACYCCPDVSRKEYCHLKLEDCRATCTTCKPKCSWKLHRYSVMEGWSSGSLKHHKNENENCPNILQLWKWIDDLLQENYGHGRDWCHTDTDQFCWLRFARSQS